MCDGESILKKTSGRSAEQEPAVLDPGELGAFVDGFLQRRDVFLQTSRQHGSPLYVIEEDVLRERAARFTKTFRGVLPDVRVYYAMKSNNHPAIARTLVQAGLGLDVSSGLELRVALDSGAKDIVFSGPGKTDEELNLAIENRDRATLLIDSFGELQRLGGLAAKKGASIRAGVRLTTHDGLWRKFGIPLAELPRFLNVAAGSDCVCIRGLQFHTSWNLDPGKQVEFIARLGNTLSKMTPDQRAMIEFIDIGGGFWPAQGEWLQSAGTAESRTADAVMPRSVPALCHYNHPATTIEDFADDIALAVRTHLFPHVSCRICAEPGRWLCNDAMHLLLTVVDKKAEDLVITDAGTNAIGWERFETDYFPVINLSRPGRTERKCFVLGSLCTPHDVWGYAYWGEGIQPGDVLLIPTQGAYTYSLRQEFIKPLPAVVAITGPTAIRGLMT
ncbi:MAG: decarboxylase [Planctomycetes bacterium]|nr:decarboxylase [Planctomycetota bacterium]